ncbi:MAG TPA: hypothetical protein VFW96_19015 [Thermomicrobiales bacterium]|nr:hypothetical protein [Thermomicrobiales bacterium]
MPARGERREPTHEWRQLECRSRADGQRAAELIRPVVLFGHAPAGHAAETGAVEQHRTRPPQARLARLAAARQAPLCSLDGLGEGGAATMATSGVAHLSALAAVRGIIDALRGDRARRELESR